MQEIERLLSDHRGKKLTVAIQNLDGALRLVWYSFFIKFIYFNFFQLLSAFSTTPL